MDDLIAEFLTETTESLADLDADLVSLEQNPNDKDLLSQIFRVMHTVKGTCGFLGLSRLEKVAHHAEDVLSLFRDGELEVTPDYVTVIFESIDRIKLIVEGIEQTGSEPEGDDSELISKLKSIYEKSDRADIGSAEDLEAAFAQAEADSDGEESMEQGESSGAEDIPDQSGVSVQESGKAEGVVSTQQKSNVSNQSLRVNVDVLENLMTMVSELVLTRNQLLQILKNQSDSEFGNSLHRLNHIVSDLQEGVMKTRMQPIGNAWAKLPRIIRDISMELGKKIELEMLGQETELDRQVLELIKDPLTHMVRNSADHGVEAPDVRVAAGKAETGKIRLNSFHQGGHIIIEIADDGKGLAVDKIKQKVLANGLATEEELEEMSPQQIQQFIFKAGFSTAEQITSVSGRGVGMDVVRTNIEKIGGSVELNSVEGKGTTFTIKIPLTLAIVSALIVEAAGERFAIPQISVRELVMTSVNGDNRIETIKGTPVLRLRNALLPLVTLEDVLKLKGTDDQDDHGEVDSDVSFVSQKSSNKYIIVAQVGSYDVGIIVDRIFDTEEIVVKPVARMLKDIEMFSGSTILGDGSVIMILDPAGIAKSSGDVDLSSVSQDEETQIINRVEEKTTLLLFMAGDKVPRAVPLELVSRLEEVESKDVEMASGHMVVQYRGELMPLMFFSPEMHLNEQERSPVLVFSDEGQSMGLIVDKIIDIAEEHLDLRMIDGKPGIVGSAIVGGQATDIIDIGYFLGQVSRNYFSKKDQPFKEGNGSDGSASKNVLLVDDSSFFRNMISSLLQVTGYQVTTRGHAAEALKLCKEGRRFDIIISDIEMPEINGLEFAQEVKNPQSSWKDIPMIALSSHATPQDISKGKAAGFNQYVAKFDREHLLTTINQTLAGDSVGHAGDAALYSAGE